VAQVDSLIRISTKELNIEYAEALRASLTFYPQEGVRVQAYRYKRAEGLWVPRGVLHVPGFLPDYLRVKDIRSFPRMPTHELAMELDTGKFKGQKDAVESIIENEQGIVHRAPGTGKTLLALAAVAQLGTRAMVIVHTDELFDQWVERAEQIVPTMSIGRIKGNLNEIGQLTVATIQTLYSRWYPPEFWKQFGITIYDEIHHAPSESAEQVLNQTWSRYRIGLTASLTRADGMEPLMQLLVGPIIHELEPEFSFPVYVDRVDSKFKYPFQATKNQGYNRKQWHGMIKALINDPIRNKLIAKETDKLLKQGRSVLVLSRRIEHLFNIHKYMEYEGTVLTGQTNTRRGRQEILKQFRSGEIKCVLSTQLFDEGVDAQIISGVVLTFPAKHRDLLFQQIGRGLRDYPGKESAVIVDIRDKNVKVLRNQWGQRRKGYKSWGFIIRVRKRKVVRGVVIKAINRSKAKVQIGTRR
jgi:superfamily II DNA or RNA helicase